MDGSIFIKGLIVGFLLAMPVGPIAVLCMQRTLNQDKPHGLISGLGAAVADAVYGFIAAFGLTFISNFLIKEQKTLRMIGAVFLCYVGIRIFLSKPVQQTMRGNGNTYVSNFVSAFFLTLANPATFLAFVAVFAGLGLVRTNMHYSSALLLVAGVAIGSGLWWFILCNIANAFLQKLADSRLRWLNRVSGIIIVCFAMFLLLSLRK